MNLWKANALRGRNDIVQRGLLRTVWLAVGYLVSWSVLAVAGGKAFPHHVVFPFLVFIVAAGVCVDGVRLGKKEGTTIVEHQPGGDA